jgi:hypothetical protein
VSLLPHQERLIAEQKELTEETHKLTAFLASAASAQVSIAENRLIHEQLGHMLQYGRVLQLRISMLPEV